MFFQPLIWLSELSEGTGREVGRGPVNAGGETRNLRLVGVSQGHLGTWRKGVRRSPPTGLSQPGGP